MLDTNRKSSAILPPGIPTEKEKFLFKRVERLIRRKGWRFEGCICQKDNTYKTVLKRSGQPPIEFTSARPFWKLVDARGKIF